MYQGFHQEDHWAVSWEGDWEQVDDERAVLGTYRRTDEAGARALFAFHGHSVAVVVKKDAEGGRLRARVDGGRPRTFDLKSEESRYSVPLTMASGLRSGEHHATLEVVGGIVALEGFIVRRRSVSAQSGVAVVVFLVAAVYARQRGMWWR